MRDDGVSCGDYLEQLTYLNPQARLRNNLYMDVEKFTLSRLTFHGDYFAHEDSTLLAEQMIGCPLEKEALHRRLAGLSVGSYFHNLSADQLITLLLC